MEKIYKSEEEWKKELAPELYEIAREKGTEEAFTGKYYDSSEEGVYKCAVCSNELFTSDTKFDSGTGWPSFYNPVSEGKIEMGPDESFGLDRTEVMCSRCGAHLGHVFDDGPLPTGKRYCINSTCLNLAKNNNDNKNKK